MHRTFFYVVVMIRKYSSLIKFSHTIFAMPFAMIGMVFGIEEVGSFEWKLFLYILACMIFARSAAMAFNRYLDRSIDAQNPRTASREIPMGEISARSAVIFTGINCVAFILCASLIRPICGYLSPVALIIILGYSYTKRFTILCHFILGLGLALAPIGAYLAVTGEVAMYVVYLGVSVMTWVGGFDIIYAMQDAHFDRENDLKSMPAILGGRSALTFSSIAHSVCVLFLILCFYNVACLFDWISWISWVGVILFIGALIYQHRIISVFDLSKVDQAFFITNGVASILLMICVLLDLMI